MSGESAEVLGATVEDIARLSDFMSLRRSPFHLAGCGGCGAPSFQQPCPTCSFYPRGEDKGSWHPAKATRELFVERVEKSGVGGRGGNLATWFVKGCTGRIPYWDSRRDEYLARAQAMDGLADAGVVYDHVARDGLSMARDSSWLEDRDLWDALDACATAVHEMQRDGLPPLPGIGPARLAVLKALHDGEGKPEAAEKLQDAMRQSSLPWARRSATLLQDARDRLAPLPSP